MENEVKLTKLAKCAGCGAKVGAGVLARSYTDLYYVNLQTEELPEFDHIEFRCYSGYLR